MRSPDELIDEAVNATFRGWDFSWLRGRAKEVSPPWNYVDLAGEAARSARRLLDIDTGGGEVFSAIVPPGRFAAATEGYEPNVAVARERLAALRIAVVHATSAPDNMDQGGQDAASTGSMLPFRDGSFDLVVDRHSSYWPTEVWRVLEPSGRFLTQQRGHWGATGSDWGELFGRSDAQPRFDAAAAADQLRAAGFAIDLASDVDTPTAFYDLGAVVYYLRAAPWTVEDFDIARDSAALERIHRIIREEGCLVVRSSHTLVDARRA